jgi:response regulator RpfG family c-di-GMP phosphodiesterase
LQSVPGLTDGTITLQGQQPMPKSQDCSPVIVLVAEDETLVRLVANDMLTEADYRVVEVKTGKKQEALAILRSRTPSAPS